MGDIDEYAARLERELSKARQEIADLKEIRLSNLLKEKDDEIDYLRAKVIELQDRQDIGKKFSKAKSKLDAFVEKFNGAKQ
jgi:hypothetical protein